MGSSIIPEPAAKEPSEGPLIIITGLSGAGRSQVMRFLEDLGCFCVDNLPPSLIPTFHHLYKESRIQDAGVVIVSDVRSGALFGDFIETIDTLRSQAVEFELLFLDCSSDTLIRRFKEVRRKHPLQAGGLSMEEAIDEERRRLNPIRLIATRIIDTSELSIEDLRATLVRDLLGKDTAHVVNVEILSFGFKYGLPKAADFVFDVRFLNNPFYEPELKPMTGEDEAVYDYVMKDPLSDMFFYKINDLISLTLGPFVEKGKTTVSIAIGCTGGRHRSVAFATRLKRQMDAQGTICRLLHRDIGKPQ